MPIRFILSFCKRGSVWIYKVLTVTVLLAGLVFAFSVLALRYWVLPNIDDYRGRIAEGVSRAANQKVQIGKVQADWAGLRPRLILQDIVLLDEQGRERMRLEEAEGTLAWLSLFIGQADFDSIELQELTIEIRRDALGNLFVAGIPVGRPSGGGKGGGLGDWLLQQRRIVLRDSRLVWTDERVSGRPLQLDDVEIRIEQRFGTRRFALRATPPRSLSAPIDIRGEMRGSSFDTLEAWSGTIYCSIAYADLAALRQWVQLPLQTTQGLGALRVWTRLEAGRPRDVTVEVALANVDTRLQPNLPSLQLARMQGRLGWRSTEQKTEWWARGLTFSTPDNVRLPPADVSYARTVQRDDTPATSEVTFDALDLEALVRLIDRLPVDAALRTRLVQINPRGALRDFHVTWQDRFALSGRYGVRGGFRNVGWQASGYLPGIGNVTGNVNATERGGTFTGKASATTLSMPKVFAAPLPVGSIDANLSWAMAGGLPDITVHRVGLANPHLSGQVSGRYRAVTDAPGVVDIKGTFPRAEGAEIWRYVPLRVHESVRDWLRNNIHAASGRDVKVTLQGDLRKFPFSIPGSGRFEVLAGIDNATIAPGTGWPKMESVVGSLAVRGHRLDISGNSARVLGANLSAVTVVIADLSEPLLQARGEAEGPSADYLRYIQQSPLHQRLAAFTDRLRVNGRGRLALKLDVPLKHASDFSVAGVYTFANNWLDPGEGAPVLDQFGGRLTFGRDEVALRDATARIFGAPARLSLNSEAGGAVRIQAAGQIDALSLQREFKRPLLTQVSGATDWKLNLLSSEQRREFVLESSLQGLASRLPHPFAKSAQDRVPLRIERRERSPGFDGVGVTYGNSASAQLVLSKAAKNAVVRGEIVVGGKTAGPPTRDGVWISGSVDRVDYEQWQELLEQESKAEYGASEGALAGVNVSIRRMRAFSRDFEDLRVDATRQQGVWSAKLGSRQVAGDLRWLPTGNGMLVGRFSRLELPVPTAEIEPVGARGGDGKDLPTIDVAADDFRMGARAFGRLSLIAVPNGPDWRIDRLELGNPDGTLRVTGLWQAWKQNARTQVNVKLELNDIGRYFARMDLPKGVEGGKGKLEGDLSWRGPPFALDLPSLSGELLLSAAKGRFLKVDPGIGKLLAVVSLQSLPKVVTFDFRDMFSQGFAFDKIEANLDIAHGVAHTRDFEMKGPAARVEMKGDVNLAAETQQLEVRIFPSLSESVALGTALVNPVIGLGALVVQKALRDPLSRILSFHYQVAGTWTTPTVTKKKLPEQPPGVPGRK